MGSDKIRGRLLIAFVGELKVALPSRLLILIDWDVIMQTDDESVGRASRTGD